MKNIMKQGFSLIELMIVVIIIGALTAVILPQFDFSEAAAKDTGCDASNYGTLDQLSKYRSLNGVYPSRMHTGYEAVTPAADETMGGTDGVPGLADATAFNMQSNVTFSALTANEAASLRDAGIEYLASGGFGINAAFAEVTTNMTVASVNADWLEDPTDTATSVTINGLPIFAYAASDPQLDYAPGDGIGDLTTDGKVIPLIIAPTTDWENAVVDGDAQPSAIGVAQEGGCPWLEGGEDFRYYLAFFKVYDVEDKPARLIGTACPECGSLNP